jgi:uncharacterized Rmd1/YagE family protein
MNGIRNKGPSLVFQIATLSPNFSLTRSLSTRAGHGLVCPLTNTVKSAHYSGFRFARWFSDVPKDASFSTSVPVSQNPTGNPTNPNPNPSKPTVNLTTNEEKDKSLPLKTQINLTATANGPPESSNKGLRKLKKVQAQMAAKRPFQDTYTNKETIPEGTARYNCIAYATADRFNFKTLRATLKQKYELTWLSQSEDFQVIHTNFKEGGEGFFFNHGSVVCWGASENEIQTCLKDISAAQVNPYQFFTDKENMEYIIDAQQNQTKMIKETIVIATKDKKSMKILNEKLALSNGIARSAKLGVLERQIEQYLSKTKNVPALMQKGDPIPLSRKEVYKHIGESLNLRGQLNLHSELLQAPDFYWTEPELEELFHMISRVLDVNFRISILNKRLDYANELVEVLRQHLSEKHGLKLEWSIILLIFIEVIFECLHYADKMGLIDPSKWIQ